MLLIVWETSESDEEYKSSRSVTEEATVSGSVIANAIFRGGKVLVKLGPGIAYGQ